MIGTEVLDALLAAGASAEVIVAAVKAAARETESRRAEHRARDAERQRRSRRSRRDRDPSRAVTRTPRDQADAPPNEYISIPPLPQSSDEDHSPALPDRIMAAWNDGPGKNGAMACRGFNPKRRSALAARRREHGETALFEAIGNLAGSPFHCGTNDRGWRASLGWLLTSAENFQKMLELGPPPKMAARTMAPEERAASLERSAACLAQIGRADDAAAMRRSAATIRAGLRAGVPPPPEGD